MFSFVCLCFPPSASTCYFYKYLSSYFVSVTIRFFFSSQFGSLLHAFYRIENMLLFLLFTVTRMFPSACLSPNGFIFSILQVINVEHQTYKRAAKGFMVNGDNGGRVKLLNSVQIWAQSYGSGVWTNRLFAAKWKRVPIGTL